jgi:hypothetical protein
VSAFRPDIPQSVLHCREYSGIKSRISFPKKREQWVRLLRQIEHEGPLARDEQ